MRTTFAVILFLTLSKACAGIPIGVDNKLENRPTSSLWKKYLPIIGTVGLLGGLAGIVILGTKADEAYKAAKIVEAGKTTAEYMALPTDQQMYLDTRKTSIGKELSDEQRNQIMAEDKMFGWPSMEMPDTKDLDRKSRRTLQSAYKKLQTAIDKASANQRQVDNINQQLKAAQFNAAVTAATEWKQALEQVKARPTGGEIVSIN
jgi:hypothetical protein